jgi:hypothetical protein
LVKTKVPEGFNDSFNESKEGKPSS